MKTYETIALSKNSRILTVKLNRPEHRNAVNVVGHTELTEVFADIAHETDVDLVILTGEGKFFSAGGDVRMVQSHYKNTEWTPIMMREARKIVRDLIELEIPIIAAVNGDAVGLGATMALMCDIIIAVDTARFGDPHVKIGLVAGDGGSVIWPLLIGVARAKEYLLTGKLISAPEAERIGLINHAVPADRFWPTVNETAEALLGNPQRAVRWTKRAINKHLTQASQLVLDMSLALEANSLMSEDLHEATQSFLEKRQPRYTGG